MKHTIRILVAAMLSVSVAIPASAAMDDASIRERIKPVGQVSIEGVAAEPVRTAVAEAAPAASASRSGSDIYQTSCVACHGSGVLQAPKLGDAAAWTERLAKGMDTVVANAINGINAMPPRGTCGACSDEEIAATVQYMVDGSR